MKIEKLINLLNDKQSESGMEVDYCSYLSKQGLAKAIYTEIVKLLEELQATPYNAELQLEVKRLRKQLDRVFEDLSNGEGAYLQATARIARLEACLKNIVTCINTRYIKLTMTEVKYFASEALKGEENGKEKRSN